MIKVITQTTNERKKETKELFEQIRPYLDNGVSFANAVKQVTGKKSFPIHNGFFRELIEYGRTLGYDKTIKKVL